MRNAPRIVHYERVTARRKEQDARAPLWLVGITDLVTLLLAFFILLFATSTPKSGSWDVASESVRNRFGPADYVASESGEAGHPEAEKTWEGEERDPGLDLDYLHSLVRKYVASDPALADVTVWHDGHAIILSLGEDLAFVRGSADLSTGGKNVLRKLAAYLDTLPNTLEVTGYTDSVPVRDDRRFSSNWHLSLLRARNVAQSLKASGYEAPVLVRGKGVDRRDNPALSGKDSSVHRPRRVDLRLHLLQP